MKIIWRAYIFQLFKDQTNNLPNGSIVYIADGTIYLGGLMDILKGIISLYDFAKEYKIPFFIFLDQHYDFTPFLQINKMNIHLSTIDRNLRENKVHYFIDNTLIQNYKNLFSKNKIHHVYTNLDILKYKYGQRRRKQWRVLFNELFRPSHHIQFKTNSIIGGRKFIACAFRFGGVMGDFDDIGNQWDHETKKIEVRILNKAIEDLTLEFPDYKVYVATDSATYLRQLINKNPKKYFCYTTEIMDMNDIERSLIELFIISKGEKIFQFKRPNMYSGYFSQYASWIGKSDYQLITI